MKSQLKNFSKALANPAPFQLSYLLTKLPMVTFAQVHSWCLMDAHCMGLGYLLRCSNEKNPGQEAGKPDSGASASSTAQLCNLEKATTPLWASDLSPLSTPAPVQPSLCPPPKDLYELLLEMTSS